jgi:hypothetical protein
MCVARNHRAQKQKITSTPGGDERIGKQFWLVAEHGMKALIRRRHLEAIGRINANAVTPEGIARALYR